MTGWGACPAGSGGAAGGGGGRCRSGSLPGWLRAKEHQPPLPGLRRSSARLLAHCWLLSPWLPPLSARHEVLLLHPSPLDGSPPWFPCPSACSWLYVLKIMGCKSQQGTEGFTQGFLAVSVPVTGGFTWTKHRCTALCIPAGTTKAWAAWNSPKLPTAISTPVEQRRLRALPCLCSEGAASGLE